MKQYSLFAALSVSVMLFALAFVKKENDQSDKHLEIVLRNIGHQILLHSKDSTSRVMPVKTVTENTFRISFEHSFEFTPDTLMNIVHQQLARTGRQGDYIVSVNDCYQNETVFAYEVDTASGDLKPCRGRDLKKSCYVIEISFPVKKSFPYRWLFLAFIPVALAGLYFATRRKRASAARETLKEKLSGSLPNDAGTIQDIADDKPLGNFVFSGSKETLSLDGEIIELSIKEAKALSLLIANLNQPVGRDILMKEIWEDDGVFVITRNVDVLISKLRKKLSADPSVKIVNVHGKGYRMTV